MEEKFDKIQFQVDANGQSLIENDALVLDLSSALSASSSGFDCHKSSENQKEPRIFDFLRSISAEKEAGLTPSSDLDEQLPDLTESSEPESARRKGKCNLRESLAWDSAFFTNAGVLDHDELSSMIKGSEKSEKITLPGIQEDIRRSTDSISTLESENLTLENLEVELFGDIRASIQKSSRVFSATNLSAKATSGECQLKSAPEKDIASQNQTKPRPGSKKPNGVSKPQTKPPIRMEGPAKAAKQDSVPPNVTHSSARTGVSTSTLFKPPRTVGKGTPISTATTKNTSSGASQAKKIENDKNRTGAGKGAQALKVPVISGVHRGLPKSLSSTKSSSLGSSTSTKSESARFSLSDSSGSLSSDHTSKSPLAAARRKINDRTVNRTTSSTLKTPSRTASKNRSTGNSALSAYLMSPKISSSISPASSISEWSSASSSSSSIINQRSDKSRTSFGNISCRSLDNDTIPSDLSNHPNNLILDGHKIEAIAICNERTRRSSTQTGTLSRPASMKPSCLRMPTPKIGYFDGAKSVRTPNGTIQSYAGLSTAFAKVGTAVSSPYRSSNMKPKMGKPPDARALSASAKTKSVVQKPASAMSSEEKLHALVKVSNTSNDAKCCPSLSLEVYDETSQESSLKFEVGGEDPRQASHGSAAGFGTVLNENLGIPSDMDGSAGFKTTPEVTSATRDSNSKFEEHLRLLERVDKDGKGRQNDIKSDPLASCRNSEKENDVSIEPVYELNRNQGHVDPSNICSMGDGHFKEKLEPASVSFSPSILKNASRTPFVDVNSISSNDCLDTPKEPAAQEIKKIVGT